MNRLSLNTHDYDGHLNQRDKPFKEEEFQAVLTEIFADIQKHPVPRKLQVARALDLLNKHRRGNWDSSNKLHAEDVLIRAWANVKKFDLDGRYVFYEQMADIVTMGSCAQGRTTRLMQFL